MVNNRLDLIHSAKIPLDSISDFERYIVKENDILIAMSGATTGKVGFVEELNEIALLNQRVGNFKIKDEAILNKKYLYYFIISDYYQKEVKRIAGGCAQPNISAKKLESIPILVPPMEKQINIVEKLENIEKLIAYKTESIGLLDSYLKSVFFDMFGDIISNSKNWNMGLLEDIALFKTKSMNPIDFDKNWYYVGLENIESQKDSFSNLSLVADNEIKSSKYYFNQDVVLYGKLRPYLNKVALPNFEGICSTDIIPILPKENSNKYFIRFLLSHEYYVNLSTQKSTGANLPRVSPTKLRKFEIPIPPIEIQNQFAKIVQQVDETKKYQLESKKELENLFNNLMQKAFKGELIC